MEFLHVEAPPAPIKPAVVSAPSVQQSSKGPPLKSLTFKVTREPWTDFFTIYLVDQTTGLPNGQTEEMNVDETIEWFRVRGAPMPLLEKALDHVWNFYKGAFEIVNYKEPPQKNTTIRPRID